MSPSFPQCFSSRHPQGSQFLLCDGSVQFISQTMNAKVYQALGTGSGGEVIDPGFSH
jgi:prepilin-type processing-associated H-X9-DG protein